MPPRTSQMDLLLTPSKTNMSPKRDYFNRKYIFQLLIFWGHVSFRRWGKYQILLDNFHLSCLKSNLNQSWIWHIYNRTSKVSNKFLTYSTSWLFHEHFNVHCDLLFPRLNLRENTLTRFKAGPNKSWRIPAEGLRLKSNFETPPKPLADLADLQRTKSWKTETVNGGILAETGRTTLSANRIMSFHCEAGTSRCFQLCLL